MIPGMLVVFKGFEFQTDCHIKKNVYHQKMKDLEKCWFMEAPGVKGAFSLPNQFVVATGGCRASADNAFPCCAQAAERALQSRNPALVQAAQDAHDRYAGLLDAIAAVKAAALKRELEDHH